MLDCLQTAAAASPFASVIPEDPLSAFKAPWETKTPLQMAKNLSVFTSEIYFLNFV